MNILKKDRELTGVELTVDELLDWRNRLKELRLSYSENDDEWYWLDKQIQYCDEELVNLTH
jgi:hypothetical protein